MRRFLAAVILLFTFQARAASWEENPQIGELFKSAGVNGAFVLYNVTAQTYIGHDQARAEKRLAPASTFKIPNTFIRLSVGAVASGDEALPYKGPPQLFIKAWAKDMRLREAIALQTHKESFRLTRNIERTETEHAPHPGEEALLGFG